MSRTEVIIGDCRLILGDCLAVLPTLAPGSVQTCITSPPYWGLRDYGHDSQIGLETTPDEYVAKLVQVFRLVRDAMRDDATLWLNLGDSYGGPAGNNRSGFGNPKDKGGTILNKGRDSAPGTRSKDLVGIPWRVAFALQQPYAVPTCVKREVDRAWLAAMFDGEGCIGIRRFDSYREEKQQVYQDGFVAYTVVTNNDIELLDRCAEVTGLGKPSLKQAADSTDGRGIVSRRDSFGWRLDGNKAIEVVAAIYPYLVAKRRQACLVYTLDRLNKNGHGSRAVPVDVQEKKRACYEMIKRCNQRESVDLPSWVEEPKQIVEPGWYLRQDIIWHKPNPMPESVTDRCTKAHEYIFLLAKSARYFYDAEAIAEPSIHAGRLIKYDGSQKNCTVGDAVNDRRTIIDSDVTVKDNRNRRSVWTVTTQPYDGAHFATFPEQLIEPCVLAGAPQGGTVLDPFCGSGTTCAVAERLGRKSIGIEANLEYVELAKKRISKATGYTALFVDSPKPKQLTLGAE